MEEHGVEVGTVIIVKFARSYCPEAHQVCYKAHRSAPRLYGCEQLAGGWKLVAMEYLRDAVPLKPRQNVSVDTSNKLRAAVAAVHDAGYVHGDHRECNILVCGGGLHLCVIDFDWYGKEGVPHLHEPHRYQLGGGGGGRTAARQAARSAFPKPPSEGADVALSCNYYGSGI